MLLYIALETASSFVIALRLTISISKVMQQSYHLAEDLYNCVTSSLHSIFASRTSSSFLLKYEVTVVLSVLPASCRSLSITLLDRMDLVLGSLGLCTAAKHRAFLLA
jgi:hypothetical protein